MTQAEKTKQQYALVVKSNDLIRKSRYSLNLVEQRFVLYLISKIKPNDTQLLEYDIDLREFCEVCGIDYINNLSQLKEVVKALRDKSIWITLPDGRETLVSWIEKPYLNHNSGTIRIRLDRDLLPYLVQLKGNFTQYELIAVLGLKSRVSLRLYELLKSYEFVGEMAITLEELRRCLMLEKEYKATKDFKRYVIDNSLDEINQFTDLSVSYTTTKTGRKITGFVFTIEKDPFFDGVYSGAEMYLEGRLPSRHQKKLWERQRTKDLVRETIEAVYPPDGYEEIMEELKELEKDKL